MENKSAAPKKETVLLTGNIRMTILFFLQIKTWDDVYVWSLDQCPGFIGEAAAIQL
jgi:hypothetical protein